MNVLFVLPVVGQPRFSKRIDMLLEAGLSCQCLAFKRDFHKGRVPNIPVEYLGTLVNDKYLSRIPVLLASISKIRKQSKSADVVYTFSADTAFLAALANIGRRKKILVLEVGDVRHLQTRKGIVGSLYRMFDKFLVSRQDLLVVTAEDFLNVYYRNWLSAKTRGIVIENKLEASQAEMAAKAHEQSANSKKDERITIGYFGLMQSKWSWRVLKKLAIDYPEKFSILLAGYPTRMDDIDEVCAKHENINFIGEYKSPDDLPSLYGKVDMAWGCYSPFGPNDWNLQWARPNRFYEACAYRTPLISRDQSTDGKYVKLYSIGHSVEESDSDIAADHIAKLTKADIAGWTANMESLDQAVYSYTNETALLVGELNAIASAG